VLVLVFQVAHHAGRLITPGSSVVVNVSDASNIIISSQPTIITTQQENAVMISSNVNDASPYRLCRFWPPSG
jgi:hypothetical protein